MCGIIDENRIRELLCVPQCGINDSTKNRWKDHVEWVGLFCAISLGIPLLDYFSNKALSTFAIVSLVIGFILFVAEIFCVIKSIRFNKMIQKRVYDKNSEFTYAILNGVFVEKTPHSESDITSYTYDFKIEGKACTFNEIQLFGKTKPAEEFAILKIIFTFQNGDNAVRIYGFNKNAYVIQLPKEKEITNAFNFDNMYGLCTFVS